MFVVSRDYASTGAGPRAPRVAPVLAIRVVLWRFLQVKFQSVQNTDRVEPFPRLAEREADLPVVRDRALKVVDKELWSEGCHTRFHCGYSHRAPFSAAFWRRKVIKNAKQIPVRVFSHELVQTPWF